MNAKTKYILAVVLFALFITGAVFGYNYLTSRYYAGNESSEPAESVASVETSKETSAVISAEISDEASVQTSADISNVTSKETSADISREASKEAFSEAFGEHSEAVSEEASAEETDESSTVSTVIINGTAPDFAMLDYNGREVKLSDFFGKPVVVNFWASWCPSCVSELGAFDSAYKSYGNDVVFLMVNLTDSVRETTEIAKKYISDKGYSFPLFFDPEDNGSVAYDVYYIPQTVFIDRHGDVYTTRVGALDSGTLNSIINEITNKQ